MTTTQGIILEANVKIDTNDTLFLELKIEDVAGWISHHYFYSIDKIKHLFLLMQGDYKGDFGINDFIHLHVNILNSKGNLTPSAISLWPFQDWVYNDNSLRSE